MEQELENVEETQQVDESKFESAGDDSVIKVDLSKPPITEENEKPEEEPTEAEAKIKAALMDQEFRYNMQLRNLDSSMLKTREEYKEDRKDKRTKIQATQQSELIEQRKSGRPPKNFESSGNDIVGGGINLDAFEPQVD